MLHAERGGEDQSLSVYSLISWSLVPPFFVIVRCALHPYIVCAHNIGQRLYQPEDLNFISCVNLSVSSGGAAG